MKRIMTSSLVGLLGMATVGNLAGCNRGVDYVYKNSKGESVEYDYQGDNWHEIAVKAPEGKTKIYSWQNSLFEPGLRKFTLIDTEGNKTSWNSNDAANGALFGELEREYDAYFSDMQAHKKGEAFSEINK